MDRDSAWMTYVRQTARVHLEPVAGPETVPNGSFEEGDELCPRDWTLLDGTLGQSTAWRPAEGDRGRHLWITPRHGGASWISAPIPIQEGVQILFRFDTKRDGVQHWAHACAVSWVSLVFLDQAMEPFRGDAEDDQPLILVRCRRTAGWVTAEKILSPPKGARFLQIGFRIDRGAPEMSDPTGFRKFWHAEIDTGQWWIDEVSLSRLRVTSAPDRAGLHLQIYGPGARLRVVNDKEQALALPGGIAYSDGGGCCHAMTSEAVMTVPAGRYRVEAMRGFDHQVFRQDVTAVAGSEVRVPVSLTPTPGWPSGKWFAGDHHVHLSFHGDTRYPLMSIDDVCRVARGEGLHYLSFCGEIVDQHAFADWRERGRLGWAKPDGAFATDNFVCSVSHEVTQDLLGHTCLVNPPGHVAPGHPWWITPTNAEVFEWVRREDGVGTVGAVALAHPYADMTSENLFQILANPKITGQQRELPVDVILGVADTMDFLAVEEPADLELRFRDYFRLLNLGLMIGVSGASDVYADQGTEIVGSLRTLVRPDRLSMNDIAMGYRRRRTMATNGPLLDVKVNGAGPGDAIEGSVARIEAKAFSNWGLARLEIVAGGTVLADATPGPDGWARIEAEHKFSGSQWIIARAWGPGHAHLNLRSVPDPDQRDRGQWAVTSPISLRVPGRPIIPRREDAEYFIRWIDASIEAIRGRMEFVAKQGPHGPTLTEDHVQKALDLFARGRKAYEDLAASAPSK